MSQHSNPNQLCVCQWIDFDLWGGVVCCLLDYYQGINLLQFTLDGTPPLLKNIVEQSLHYLWVEFNLFWILFWLPLWVVSRSTFGPLATVLFWDSELPFQFGLLLFFQRTLFG